MKLKMNFKQTRATSAGNINSPNLLDEFCGGTYYFFTLHSLMNAPGGIVSPDCGQVKVNGYTFKGSNSFIFVFADLLLKERICSFKS